METVADVVARGREQEGTVLDSPGRTASYSYREFCTNAWKAGNLLRHYGVRGDGTVGVVVGPKSPGPEDSPGTLGGAADPLVGFFGGASLGATVDVTPESPVEARALVVPDAWLDRYEVTAGCSRLAYGGPPEQADVAHFERELWSENPVEPPGSVAPGDVLLHSGGAEYTHEEILDAASAVTERHDLAVGDSVRVETLLTDPGTVAAGVVAPMTVGATIRPGAVRADPDESVTYVVSSRSEDLNTGSVNVVNPTAVIDPPGTRRA